MLLTLAAYKIAQDNVNVIDPDYTSYSIQQGQYETRGLELEGRWNIARNFSVYGAYAYVDSEVTETSAAAQDTLGKQIPLQTKQSASLGGHYPITSGARPVFGLGCGVRS